MLRTWLGTIDEAMEIALRAAGIKPDLRVEGEEEDARSRLDAIWDSWGPEARYLRGLSDRGTFCYQAQQILR